MSAADPSGQAAVVVGAVNIVNARTADIRGTLATPIVYHDPDKELLLTYLPPELVCR